MILQSLTVFDALQGKNVGDLDPPLVHLQGKICITQGMTSLPVLQACAFPRDYPEAISQAQAATKAALDDGNRLVEIEFPTAGLTSVSGAVSLSLLQDGKTCLLYDPDTASIKNQESRSSLGVCLMTQAMEREQTR